MGVSPNFSVTITLPSEYNDKLYASCSLPSAPTTELEDLASIHKLASIKLPPLPKIFHVWIIRLQLIQDKIGRWLVWCGNTITIYLEIKA